MRYCLTLIFLLAALLACHRPPCCNAAEVVIVADRSLKPAVEIISGIRKSLTASTRTYSPADVSGKLNGIVEKEGARVVITLGREALNETLHLPPSIPVIYAMVVTPPRLNRPNTTGFYMATPTSQYLDLINTYLPSIERIAVIGNRDQLKVLAGETTKQVSHHNTRNCFEFVTDLQELNGSDAIQLLPDTSLLTATAMEEALLFSFRKKIPLLGFSEKQVRDGALFALVVDTVHQGRLIGEHASKALKGIQVGQLPPSPPRRFELFLNLETARKMGIRIPDALLRMTRRVYP
jgi:ABC-type uncharacterized transport system substrate-binding protein